jgi:hypothetical protein
LFRSVDGGNSFAPVLGGLIWSLQQTSAGWLAAGEIAGVARSCSLPIAASPGR